MEAVTRTEGRALARPLHVLVPLIKQDLRQGDEEREQAGIEHYRAAGEKMLEAKEGSFKGDNSGFQKWLGRNFNLSKTHAYRYMKLVTVETTSRYGKKFENFSEFMREEGGDPGYGKVVRKREWHDPVKEAIGKVNVEALKQDALARQDERALQRKLALNLIDIGYKALATKLHPDKGGSREAMARLNRVRDMLKSAVSA